MTQHTLFDIAARSRCCDPSTSREGARHIERKLNELQGRMAGAFTQPRTANEAALECVALFGGSHESYRKRKGELVKLGVIRGVGKRKCRVTGSNAEVFLIHGMHSGQA